MWKGSWLWWGDTQRLSTEVPGHVGLKMPGRQQRFSDAPQLGHVVAGIDGSDLGLDNELATEITIQHGLDAMLQNVKRWQREAWPVSRTVPLPVAQASSTPPGYRRATAAWAGTPIGDVDIRRSGHKFWDLRMADKLS